MMGSATATSHRLINQDNDIVNTITGNNNTVTNNQDNSISQEVYGSSNRSSRKKAWH